MPPLVSQFGLDADAVADAESPLVFHEGSLLKHNFDFER
jgi:hypothetical protein